MGTESRSVVTWGWGKGLTIKSEDHVLGLNCDGGIHLPESIELYTYKG